jgi:uncharacterized membrane protein YkvI
MKNEKIKLLYAVGIGLVISDIVPTPADALYFYLQRINKQKLEKGEITVSQYWTRDAISYYALNPIWWAGILAATYFVGKTYEQKRNILIGLIGAGAVFGVLAKNIQKDKEFYKTLTIKQNGK